MAAQGRGTGGTRPSAGRRTAGGRPAGAPARPGRRPKRRLSARQRAIYRRRRIVVGLLAVVFLALAVFCGYSLVRFAGATAEAVGLALRHDELTALARKEAPKPKPSTGVSDCASADVRLELSAKTQTVPVGGTMEWTATIRHEGSGSCLIDGSDAARVLTITSGDQVVWRSDACPADPRRLLMARGDKDIQSIIWNTDSNTGQDACKEGTTLPKVNPGAYVGTLSLKADPKVASDPVPVLVQ